MAEQIVAPVLVLPGCAYHGALLDSTTEVRALSCAMLSRPEQGTWPLWRVIGEPVTQLMVRNEMAALTLSRAPGLTESTQALIRNELRFQITCEKQKELTNARATLPGFEYAAPRRPARCGHVPDTCSTQRPCCAATQEGALGHDEGRREG